MPPGVDAVRVALDGWTPAEREARTAVWHDDAGNALSLHVVDELDLALAPPPRALQAYFRRLAEAAGGGLVEAEGGDWRHGPAAHGIYKKAHLTGFTFIGLLCMPMPAAALVWSMGATERGTTGLREAMVTAMLLEREGFSPESFERTWAQDPYDPDYRALGRVDRQVLRYRSDDVAYDGVVPGHPLSRVRRAFRHLRETVDVDVQAFGVKPGPTA